MVVLLSREKQETKQPSIGHIEPKFWPSWLIEEVFIKKRRSIGERVLGIPQRQWGRRLVIIMTSLYETFG